MSAFSAEALARAFGEVGPSAMPGVDGQSGAAFARALSRECEALAAEVATGRYRPRPLLRRERAKEGGGVRVLGIPTVRDRVVQRAALEAIRPTVEARLSPRVHGYRPGRSTATALAMLGEEAGACEGTCLIRADVAALFDELPHTWVRRTAKGLRGGPWPELLERWLEAWATAPGRGVPQGAPLSPDLANLVLDAVLDRPLRQARPPLPSARAWVRYGDDVLLVARREEGPRLLSHLGGLLAAAGLRLAPGKVQFAEARRGPVPFPVLGARLRWTAWRGGLRLEIGL